MGMVFVLVSINAMMAIQPTTMVVMSSARLRLVGSVMTLLDPKSVLAQLTISDSNRPVFRHVHLMATIQTQLRRHVSHVTLAALNALVPISISALLATQDTLMMLNQLPALSVLKVVNLAKMEIHQSAPSALKAT